MELTAQQRSLLIECVECTDAQQSRQLTDKLETLMPNRNWGYIWDPVGKITFQQEVYTALGPPYSHTRGEPADRFLPAEKHPARTMPLDPAAVHTRSPAAPEPRQATRPLRFEDYPAEVRAAFLRGPEPPAEPEPEVPRGYVKLDDGSLMPAAAFKC